ncbi:MAG: hypothetical protein COB02_00090 [Candidatus Cloacimonadota bacterium]|nr:MAG: hypothetical protein COB02_04225 [Candidatus Cloacimonadota bacterium]PCJ21022.1 MAG: hypothetical protein COB02_00090 [Candidatus Cloacimonadota bacterium]
MSMSLPSFKSLIKQKKTKTDICKESIAYLCKFGSDTEKAMLKELISQEEDKKIKEYYYSLLKKKEKTIDVLDKIQNSIEKSTKNTFAHGGFQTSKSSNFFGLSHLKRLGFSLGALVVIFSFGYRPVQKSLSFKNSELKTTLNIISSKSSSSIIKRQVHDSKGRKILALDIVVSEKYFDLKSQFFKILIKEKNNYWGIRVRFFSQKNLKKPHHHLFASLESSKLMEDFSNMYTSEEWIIVWD